jgi:hypothetical protein
MIRRSLDSRYITRVCVVKRASPHPPRKSFNWRGCLIESAIAIAVLNIIAALAWYFILRHLNP